MREARGNRHLATASGTVLAVCVVVVAGCGGSDASSGPSTAAEPTHQAAEQEAPPLPPPSFKAKVRIETESEEHDGSSARQRLELAKLAPAGHFEPPSGFASLLGICVVNDRRDALMPGRLIIENTTKGFPIEIDSGPLVGPNTEFPGAPPYENAPLTEVAQRFSTGPSCLEPTGFGDPAGDAEFTVRPGETIRHNFLIVVHGYYQPATPEGNKQGFADLRAHISSLPPIAGGWETVCLTASAPLDGEAVRLDGGPIDNYQFGYEELPAC